MNRRSFLSAVAALAAVIPAASAAAKVSKQFGLRITVSHPPEPGFEYANGRRWYVYCDDVMLDRCVRADEQGGKAWTLKHEQGVGGGPVVTTEVEHRGRVRLERIA